MRGRKVSRDRRGLTAVVAMGINHCMTLSMYIAVIMNRGLVALWLSTHSTVELVG
jgi:LDH2 family malate/lactate/ureidoglycolate dehydrogenase